jgi:membrane protease subunit HflK
MPGDQNIALVSATAKYTISDPVAYALHVSEVSSMVDSCISNAMVEVSAKTRVEDILTSGKLEFASTISARAQEKFDAAGMGISLQALELTNVNMPEEVREIYEEVNAATVTAKTLIEQAQQYYNTNIPLAQSSAQTLLSNANVNYSLSISSAQTSLAEFYGTIDEFNASPETVKERIFNQKMAAALRNIGTVRLVEDGDSKIFIDWGEK